MNIVFTGHRDCNTDFSELERVAVAYPGDTWIHGGAEGFDTQVAECATKKMIHQIVVRPDYSTGSKRAALILRNMKMVDMADVVVACYDGRSSGGTAFTISYAKEKNKPIIFLRYCSLSISPH